MEVISKEAVEDPKVIGVWLKGCSVGAEALSGQCSWITFGSMTPFPLDYLQFSDYPLTRPTVITLGARLASYSRDCLQPDGKNLFRFHLVATTPCL